MEDDDRAAIQGQASEQDDDWLSAFEAVGLVRASTTGANIAIATRAFAGLVTARAELLTFKSGTAPEKRHEDANVPRDFWWATGHPALVQNWPTGDFSTWIENRIHVRAFGVRFARADIERMLPAEPIAEASAKETRSEGRGRRMSTLWPDWVAELAAYLHENGAPSGTGSQGSEETIGKIADRMAERGLEAPPRTTVQPTIAAVLRRLRQA